MGFYDSEARTVWQTVLEAEREEDPAQALTLLTEAQERYASTFWRLRAFEVLSGNLKCWRRRKKRHVVCPLVRWDVASSPQPRTRSGYVRWTEGLCPGLGFEAKGSQEELPASGEGGEVAQRSACWDHRRWGIGEYGKGEKSEGEQH